MTFLTMNGDGWLDCETLTVHDVTPKNIAEGLWSIKRFVGQLPGGLNVLQHSLVVGQVLDKISPRLRFLGLVHDAAEAFTNDIPSPIKDWLPQIRDVEDRLLRSLLRSWGTAPAMSYERRLVKDADVAVLLAEIFLFGVHQKWLRYLDKKEVPATIVDKVREVSTLGRDECVEDFVAAIENYIALKGT